MRYLPLFLTAAATLSAADRKPGDPLERQSVDLPPVITDIDEALAEPDFPFVGEYRGYERPTGSPRSSRSVSLQVNAGGAGQFVATRVVGGTPAEFAADAVTAFTGQRAGGRLVLTEKDAYPSRLRYVVAGGQVTVEDRFGREVGRLTRSGRLSPTLGQEPPPGAIVLFDGTGTERLKNGKITPDGLLVEGTETLEPYGDFRLHLEFRLPYKPNARGQHRGNSGVYIQSRYELQVLDSFGWPAAFNDVGALYRTIRPDRNASLPPLSWQTYDIDFRAAEFAGGQKVRPARITAWLNGVKIHDNRTLPNKTGAGKPEAGFPLPTKFQAHKNPVRYRNMWLLPEGAAGRFGAPPAAAPVPPVPVATF